MTDKTNRTQTRSAAERPDRDEPGLDVLLDVPLEITVELGRTRRLLEDVLKLSSGSVIQLDRLAGEAVDILINGELVAKGEVLVIDEHFGVRVTELVQRGDRSRIPGRRA